MSKHFRLRYYRTMTYFLFDSVNFLQAKIKLADADTLFDNFNHKIVLRILFKCAIGDLSLPLALCAQLNNYGNVDPTPIPAFRVTSRV